MTTAKTKVCMVVGDPVDHSLSPIMHNAGYKALGIDSEFVFVAAKVTKEDGEKVVGVMKSFSIHAISCTMPHKLIVNKYVDELDETARKIGSVNTLLNKKGKVIGYNTDWLGTQGPLLKKNTLKGKRVAVLGAGGLARAVLYALTVNGANVTLFNRTLEKAKQLSQEFQCATLPLHEVHKIQNMDVIINTTSVGMNGDQSLVPNDFIVKEHLVFDAIYHPYETRLLKDALEKGATVIHGTEMLLYQALAQFELYTGRKAPEDVMRKVLLENIQ